MEDGCRFALVPQEIIIVISHSSSRAKGDFKFEPKETQEIRYPIRQRCPTAMGTLLMGCRVGIDPPSVNTFPIQRLREWSPVLSTAPGHSGEPISLRVLGRLCDQNVRSRR